MAKKKATAVESADEATLTTFDHKAEGIVGDINIADSVEEKMKIYGMMTVEDRAIPDYRDGLKKVHRRILWAMYQAKLFHTGSLRKAASVVGDTIGDYHPHGDLSIYGGMVSMVNFKDPLIHGEGNWGTMVDEPAAYRYTECKLTKMAWDNVVNPYNMSTVQTVPNYDGRTVEPLVFVPNLPLVFLYANGGIAVGTTTDIPTFTLESLRKLLHKAMKRTVEAKKFVPVTAKDCYKYLTFAHQDGGHVTSGRQAILDFFGNTSGRIEWACDYTFNEKGNHYSVVGFPPEWGLAGKMKFFEEKIAGVKQVLFTNDKERGGLPELKIILKKQNPTELAATRAQVEAKMVSAITYRVNIIERRIVKNGEIDESAAKFSKSTVPGVLNDWIQWRVGEHTKALQLDQAEQERKLARETLLYNAINHLDEMFKMLKAEKEGNDKVKALAKLMKISIEESETIWSLAIGRFGRLSHDAQAKKMAALKDRIKELKSQLKQPFASTYAYLKKTPTETEEILH